MSKAEAALAVFSKHLGAEEGIGEWHTVDQGQIDAFADATGDHQFIHVDPEKAAQLSPYKVTIAHGFLTLSMLTHLAGSVKAGYGAEPYAGIMMGVNYGFDKVRFVSPVPVGARVRVHSVLSKVELKKNAIQQTRTMTVEVEGAEKPALVADWLTRAVYA